MLSYMEYESPVGRITLVSDGTSLIGAYLDGQRYFAAGLPDLIPGADGALTAAARWLDCYFAGQKPSPDALPLRLTGSEFRQRVLRELLRIPHGKTTTYSEIADRLGCRSAQAIGGAVGHNPISIIIPCHRVLGADGSLTGYAGGLDRKCWLLHHEGVILRGN